MKKIISLILCLALAMTLVACGADSETNVPQDNPTQPAASQNDAETGAVLTDLGYPIDFSEDPYEVRMVITVQTGLPSQEGIDRIVALINEHTLRDLNMTLKLEILSFAQYMQTIPLELANLEKLDLLALPYEYGIQFTSAGYYNDLAPLLDTYGPHIMSTYPSEAVAKACTMDGFLFGVPVHKESCIQRTVIFRTDLLEKYQIDVSNISTLDDLNEVFAILADKEPGMWVTTLGKDMGGFPMADQSVSTVGACLMDMANSSVVENYYASEEFAEWITMTHEWNQKGWINPAAATDDQYALTFIMGQTASIIHDYGHPLTESELEGMTGFDLTLVRVTEPYCTTQSCAAWNYAIPAGSQAPEKAMIMLDYIMTQPAVMNLLNWGEEGVDYVVKDGLLDYPEGKDASTIGYNFRQGWILPNQFICTPWITDGPDVYNDFEGYNATAKNSLAIGFNFDPSAVMNEIAAVANVKEEYYNALNTGSVDPEEYLPEFLQALEDAGMQTVVDEVQRQLDAFLASKD